VQPRFFVNQTLWDSTELLFCCLGNRLLNASGGMSGKIFTGRFSKTPDGVHLALLNGGLWEKQNQNRT
jgi:hypothetical protein